jgi:predicted AlkP superfamily phosphohydrolase/phosphomutase
MRLVVIGIDSMDRRLIHEYLDNLPTFRKLVNDSPGITLNSVFPPDSDTAWASIYTGLNPAQHGVVNFIDPLKKAALYQTDYLDNLSIRNRTFWDVAGKNGKTVCLIYPHAAYPVWEVNGFMIAPRPKTDEFQVYPPSYEFNFKVEELKLPRKIPDTKQEYKQYLGLLEKLVVNEFNFAMNMFDEQRWDLFFFYSCALDFVQHVFWNYCYPDDPTYPGDTNPFRNVIRDFYILHDQHIGEMIKKIDSDTSVMVLSDHGHSMRPIKLFNMNEVLRKSGYLVGKQGPFSPVFDLNEKLKRAAVNVVQRLGFRKFAMNLLRTHPGLEKMYTVPSSIDFERSVAFTSDLSGMKSYTYGGIFVSKGKLTAGDAYTAVRDDIISTISAAANGSADGNVIEWICPRELLYDGEHISKYPDVLFKLKGGYGAGWGIKLPFFSKTPAHNLFPGSHEGSTPVLLLSNLGGKKCAVTKATLMDIAPTVLDILGVDSTQLSYDGASVLAKQKMDRAERDLSEDVCHIE